jgi:hypothetical protein
MSLTFIQQKKPTSTLIPAKRGHADHQTVFQPPEAQEAPPKSGFGHEFGKVDVLPRERTGPQFSQTCPLTLASPRACPFGGACHTCPAPVQAKLTISQPGDKYEQEADRVADRIMSMPEPAGRLQRACSECEDEVQRQPEEEEEEEVSAKLLQRQPEEEEEEEEVSAKLLQRQPEEEEEEETVRPKAQPGQTTQATPAVTAKINALHGGGQPLSPSSRAFFEPRFGHDFSQVRVHSDTRAADTAKVVNARAFTVGRDVVFGAGQYTPDSQGGRRLMAHELTHVVQQAPNMGMYKSAALETSPQALYLNHTIDAHIQRALKCSLGHIEKEYKGAASSCQSIQNSYCKTKYPKPSDIEELHKNAVKGANTKKKDIPHAAVNLLHFLSGSGTEKVMPIDIFKNHTETKDQLLDTHREKFIAGAEKRLKSGKLKPGGGPVEMVWTDTANAFSLLSEDDLGLAVGGYTLCSKVKVSATDMGGGKTEITFDEWTVQAFDCYNWDPGKGIGLPGATDNDLCCLQNAGKSKHFRIHTAPWKNGHTPSMAKFTI